MKQMKLGIVAIVVLSLLTVNCRLLGHRTVVFRGTSMLPNIKDGDRLPTVMLDSNSRKKLIRGEIVVFRSPMDPSKSYIKRLIGLPGDKIEMRGGGVWINESKLSEPYVSSKFNLSPRSQPAVIVPQDAYFILGDNRDNSADSRIWGCVPAESVYAKVIAR